VLFVVAERVGGARAEPAGRPTHAAPRGFWAVFAAGCALCGGAGILVYRYAPPAFTHAPWLAGLATLAACAAWSRWRDRSGTWPSRQTVAACLLLLLLAGGFFGWRVTSIPPEVHGDEGEEGMDAVALLDREPFNLFTTGWYWLPRFHVLRQAAGIQLFGVNRLGLRCTSVVVGAASVLLIFAVGARLWGGSVGLLAGLLLVSARFFIHLSRTGLEYIDTPFLSLLVVWLALHAWREQRLGAAILCGVALGLGIQSYYASRLVPILLTLTWLIWLIGSERALVRRRLGRFAVIAISAIATAAPMIGYFWNHRSDLWMRTRETSVFGERAFDHLAYNYGTRSRARIIAVQAQHAVTLFNATPDSSLQYGYRGGGLFEPVSAALFVLGLGLLCARPHDRRHLLLLLWIAIPLIAGGALTIDTPFYPRIGGAVPFAVLAVAVALRSLLASLRDVLPAAAGRAAAGLAGGGVVAMVFTHNIQSYFFDYAPHHRHGPGVEIAEWIRANGSGKTTYLIGGKGFYIKHGTIRFLTYSFDTADVLDLDAQLKSFHFDPATSLFIIMPQGQDLIPKLGAAVGPLDVKAQHYRYGAPRDGVAFFTAVPMQRSGAAPSVASVDVVARY
jgi:4-amino-4-deoxy-L-arabinose transferase-like glycosyltransferase